MQYPGYVSLIAGYTYSEIGSLCLLTRLSLSYLPLLSFLSIVHSLCPAIITNLSGDLESLYI